MNTIQLTEVKDGFLEIKLNRPKANAINHEMVKELTSCFKDLEKNTNIKGAYLIGSSPFFSAGLDVIELFGYDEQQIKTFWIDFGNMIKTMAACPKPLVAAISGHSPAGGCVLALCADYRIMQEGDYKIGLNEVGVGVVVPHSIFELYSFAIGRQQAYQALMTSKLHNVKEAKDVGLIHMSCDEAFLTQTAHGVLDKFCKMDAKTWTLSKLNVKHKILEKLTPTEELMEPTLSHWWSPAGRSVIEGLINNLTKK